MIFNSLTGELAGGTVEAGGVVAIGHKERPAADLWLRAKHMGINYPEDVRAAIDADLEYRTGGNLPMLSGEIDLLHSVVTRNVDPKLRSVVTLMVEKLGLAPDASQLPVNFQLQIRSIDPVAVSNNLGRVQADVDLKVSGNNTVPTVDGTIKIEKGSKLYLQTRIFVIEHGDILLKQFPALPPRLDLMISSRIPDDETKQVYDVRMPMLGPMDNLVDVPPQSSPPLLPQQIYFLLLTGRAQAQLTKAESRFLLSQFLTYYSVRTGLPVPEKLPGKQTLNTVEINPESILSERDPGDRWLNGKDLVNGVSMLYSLPLSDSSEQMWIANYVIRKNVSFRFIDHDDGSYSSNIQHSLRFGRSSPPPAVRTLGIEVPKIGKVDWDNKTSWSIADLQKEIPVVEGEPFDSIRLQEKAFAFREKLQAAGYFFPYVALDIHPSGKLIDIRVSIDPRGVRKMTFTGYQPDAKSLAEYQRWWREGFREESVLGMVRSALMSELWRQQYHRASVDLIILKNNGAVLYEFKVTPGPRFQVNLAFDGIESMKAGDVKSELTGLFKSEDEMNADALHNFSSFSKQLQLVYVKHGFLDTQVAEGKTIFSIEEGKVEKQISIVEGPSKRIARIIVSSPEKQFPDDLQKRIKLNPGSIFDPVDLAEDELTIEQYYENQGYWKARVRSKVQQENGELVLRYDLQTGEMARVGKIIVQGNIRTARKTIESQLPFEPGDVLAQEKLAEAQKHLYDMKLFRVVKVHAVETTPADRYDVLIEVNERANYELAYSAGYNSEKHLEGVVQITDWNLMGRGHSMSFLGKMNSEDKVARLVYHEPDSSGLKWKTLAAASYEELGRPLLFTVTKGIELQHQFPLAGKFVLVTGYRFDRVRVTELDPTDIYYVGEAPVNVSRLEAVLLVDTRNDPLVPTKGNLVSIQNAAAPAFLGSGVSFLKNYSQFFHYQSFGKIVWASGIRLGMAKTFGDDLIATERFFAGGSFSVRGFEKDRLGPRDPIWGRPMGGEAVFLINQEVRFPLPVHQYLGGVLFYDAGNVYNHAGDFDLSNLRHSLGAGIRLLTPFGVGRIDWGFNLNPMDREKRSVFHFALGQAF